MPYLDEKIDVVLSSDDKSIIRLLKEAYLDIAFKPLQELPENVGRIYCPTPDNINPSIVKHVITSSLKHDNNILLQTYKTEGKEFVGVMASNKNGNEILSMPYFEINKDAYNRQIAVLVYRYTKE